MPVRRIYLQASIVLSIVSLASMLLGLSAGTVPSAYAPIALQIAAAVALAGSGWCLFRYVQARELPSILSVGILLGPGGILLIASLPDAAAATRIDHTRPPMVRAWLSVLIGLIALVVFVGAIVAMPPAPAGHSSPLLTDAGMALALIGTISLYVFAPIAWLIGRTALKRSHRDAAGRTAWRVSLIGSLLGGAVLAIGADVLIVTFLIFAVMGIRG